MKAILLLFCLLLASFILVPSSVLARALAGRQLDELAEPPTKTSPVVTRPSRPACDRSRGQPYLPNCYQPPRTLKPPTCTGPYKRNCTPAP
ncbi:hypothetical protein I3842_16G096400 [Carya illinoinensis]|uniref:Uncharacterized protein n=1 Tax=Carya illinoinensis TaxID=32201 RepID=A0A922D196_CARIL|nr:hypothetical protein I3842_16G096400 [Carya illinoinensis]